MVDIYIKSFNRPYFLDRCLYSIYRYVTGDFQVIVMDDGTPEKYVRKMAEKYPSVKFTFTEEAPGKRDEIENAVVSGKDNFTSSVPVKFWRKTIEHGTDVFFLMEDDIWITEPIDMDVYARLMKNENINQIKIRWCGNENTNIGKRKRLNDHIEVVIPDVPFIAEMIVKNRFYLHSILLKLKQMRPNYFLQLYTYYDIGGVMYDKKFWLSLWPESLEHIEEMIQLGKAAEWARKHPKTQFAKCITESARTTFLTSAAGGYNEKTGFSMTMVNHYINEEWYNGNFDILENFPDNYSLETIYTILQKSGDVRCDPEKWKRWSLDFQAHFVGLGASPKG